MDRVIYADSERCADLIYATHFFAPDPFLYFSSRGKSHVVLSDLEIDRARRTARVDRVLAYGPYREELVRQLGRKPSASEFCLHVLRRHRVRRAAVPADFPLELARSLEKGGIRLMVPEEGLFPARARKRPAEVRQIRRALRVAEKLIGRVREILKAARVGPGRRLRWGGSTLTSERLRTEVQVAAFRLGAAADHPILAGGVQACDPHERGHGPLKAGELVVVDIFPRMLDSRYWGDMTRTFVKGRASDPQRRLFETVRRAQRMAFETIRAGLTGDRVHAAVSRFFEVCGCRTGARDGRREGFFHGTGHGLGLDIHEAPSLSVGSPARLQSGNVVTVEPGLYYPAIGGVRIEDVVLVTDQGNRKLSRFPTVLEV